MREYKVYNIYIITKYEFYNFYDSVKFFKI